MTEAVFSPVTSLFSLIRVICVMRGFEKPMAAGADRRHAIKKLRSRGGFEAGIPL
jgi:hypothetical protein